jgi:hypothetical protein
MDAVYILWHSHPISGNEDDEKLIGGYATEKDARGARDRTSAKPGFVDYPAGFEIVKYAIGEDHWTEGYVTV